MNVDVLIVGGSFAGLTAAMQLVRGRRNVLVVDAGAPRNRFSAASHGIFCIDGKTPEEIHTTALSQLRAYPTFDLKEDIVSAIEKTPTGFNAQTEKGMNIECKRVILAMGITDKLPEIPGLKERWGKSVMHCPYCHGYELSDRPLGVLASNDMSFHQAAMIPEWGATTLFTQGEYEPQAETLAHLQSRGVTIERTPVAAVMGHHTDMDQVKLSDGRLLPLEGLYVAPRIQLPSLIEQLALELEEAPLGAIVKVNEMKESSMEGVFVAGDLSNAMQNGTFAVASGCMAGIAAHRSFIFE
ncbi:NAD(P)/FAD-dependent oxidoreductase [Pseudohongiella nitratireducens]|uniref:NAD(P)/FAD-dependent oxidoreductase n=1 Tax=Pseudohongiella nitratireducens TaxID=1768907 RepID=UPI0030EBEFB2|tara:strand:+ start:2837 stop:3730 length:894 start_codon:yes stop_codon:yes gene_type:complete